MRAKFFFEKSKENVNVRFRRTGRPARLLAGVSRVLGTSALDLDAGPRTLTVASFVLGSSWKPSSNLRVRKV